MTRPFTPIKFLDGRVVGMAAAQADAYVQDLHELSPFAPLRQNNQVECFTTGEDYFAALRTALKAARKSIFISGWQVNWDVELAPAAHPHERLIDILAERVQSSASFRVFVMPWMSPKIGVNTNDLETMLAIFQLNAGRKTMQAMCCPAGGQSDYVGTEGAAFSHHQKLIVIDNEIAYIGGMDLAYGRFDDHRFSLNAGKDRHFNERYNPGVPGSHTVTPKDGACLSMMDLLMTTLTSGKWNSGGNSEPGAVSRFIHGTLGEAEEWAVKAVAAVNQGQRFAQEAHLTVLRGAANAVAGTVKAGGRAMVAVANADAEIVLAAANAVSRTAARLRIPDLHGAVNYLKVDANPGSSMSDALRQAETSARKGWNASVEDIASVADFLSPLKRLRVRAMPHSPLPGTIEQAGRAARAGVNTVIDSAAALAGSARQAAEQGRQVLVEIAPAVQAGVDHARKGGRQAVAGVKAGVDGAERTVVAGLNGFQQVILEAINKTRQAAHEQMFALVALGDRTADKVIENLSQANVQATLNELMRLAKLIYASQLALSWEHAAVHPLLLTKGTKLAAVHGTLLGKTQPRQPWQDVQVQIKGPSVDDVARNFIGRWNAAQESYLNDETLSAAGALVGPVFGRAGAGAAGALQGYLSGGAVRKALLIPLDLAPAPRRSPVAPPTGVAVRVLRSAPLKMCTQEALARKDKAMPVQEQREIQTQMVNLIKGATDFIYIENQFYVTDFGKPSINVFSDEGKKQISGPMQYMAGSRSNRLTANVTSAGSAAHKDLLPSNDIGKALGERIALSVRQGEPFHVYLVLPVHPEGSLDDITVAGQVHWTMQSLVFADRSLINLVRRAIAAKQLCKNTLSDTAWAAALEAAGKGDGDNAPYHKVREAQWSKYLTLLNLRNCETVDGVVRTEQIYIHSKLLIVDDRHVIVGSANINDRSQSGRRDSEIAVMLFDTAKESKTIGDKTTFVNTLARKLRVDIWKKHFALSGGNDIVKAATEMTALIERPAAEATIKLIQKLAAENAGIYKETFPHVPWSHTDPVTHVETGASLWPVCPRVASEKVAGELSVKMPFHKDFWLPSNHPSKVPVGIKGFFTKLATNWTMGENNHPNNMNVIMLTMLENGQEQGPLPGDHDYNQNTSNA